MISMKEIRFDIAHPTTNVRGGRSTGITSSLLAPPVETDVSRTNGTGSTSNSDSDQDRSFQSPMTRQCHTPATSLGEDRGTEEGGTEGGTDGDDDLVSNFSDVADDESFLEAVAASSLDPDLLPLVLTLKEYVLALAEESAEEWQSRGGGARSHGSGTPSETHLRPASAGVTGTGNSNGRKRALSSDEYNSPDGDDEEEDPKRQRTGPEQGDDVVVVAETVFLACPFMKRNPEEDWPKSCSAGYPMVHRIKYVSCTLC